jgi:hypothetical protein
MLKGTHESVAVLPHFDIWISHVLAKFAVQVRPAFIQMGNDIRIAHRSSSHIPRVLVKSQATCSLHNPALATRGLDLAISSLASE